MGLCGLAIKVVNISGGDSDGVEVADFERMCGLDKDNAIHFGGLGITTTYPHIALGIVIIDEHWIYFPDSGLIIGI